MTDIELQMLINQQIIMCELRDTTRNPNRIKDFDRQIMETEKVIEKHYSEVKDKGAEE